MIKMGWFNYYGLIFIAIIMTPNIVFAITNRDGFKNKYKNKLLEISEQIGRYACIILMVFNIPYTYFGFWFEYALAVYLIVNGALCLLYLICWIVFWDKGGKFKTLSLSIIPSLLFLYSGIAVASIPLIVFAVLFAINHVLLSYKNSIQ